MKTTTYWKKIKIPTYIINRKSRTDRKQHILRQFRSRHEFDIHIIEAHEHSIGSVGLWITMKNILQSLVNEQTEYAIICEDDHEFTEAYSIETFLDQITRAKKNNADVLSGGVSWSNCAIPIARELFWVQCFTGTQFIVVFKKFFKQFCNCQFYVDDSVDFKISALSNNIFLIYPFISIQKDFGYSDVTIKNNEPGKMKDLFQKSAEIIQILQRLTSIYKEYTSSPCVDVKDAIRIPTYIINLPERKERRNHILKEFEGRNEFLITIIEACKDQVGAVGLWKSIRKVIEMAIKNKDDVIIVCEDDHQFTETYSKESLIRNLVEAYIQHADYVSGGTGKFAHAVRITNNRFWVSSCLSTQFIILYKKFFQTILDAPFDDTVIADLYLSELTSNKMVLYPFISRQKDFGYSDITQIHNDSPGIVNAMFEESNRRLGLIQKAYEKYTPITH